MKKTINLIVNLIGLLSIGLNLIEPANAQALNTNQSAAREHINTGNNYLHRQAFEQAIKEYDAALQVDPSNRTAKGNLSVAHNNWGIYFAHQKKYEEAIGEFEKVLQLDPNFQDAKRNISLVKQDMAREQPDTGNPVWDPHADEEKDKHKASKPESKNGSKKETGADSAPKQKEEPASAVILTPGLKSKTTNSESASPPAVAPDGGVASYGTNLFNTQAPASAPATANPSSSSPAIEDQLSAIEQKVYGHKQADMPVFKRIEKLETDTSGAPRQGNIKERIEYLRQNYGL